VDVVVDGVVVVVVLATVLVIMVVVVLLVSRVVVNLVMFVDEPSSDHFQVSQTQLVQLAVGRCSQNYDSGILEKRHVFERSKSVDRCRSFKKSKFAWFYRATVCKTVRPTLSDRCLSVCPVCLSVTLVYCGQTVGWIKMKLGVQVDLDPGHIVLDGVGCVVQR